MTSKTFIRLVILCTVLTASAVLYSASRPHAAAPRGEDGIQCREKNDDTHAQSDNTEIWESISRHLLGAN
jgi:hypothetical protein